MADVRELARQLGEAVVTDEKFVALQSAQAEYDNDAELQQLIQEFNLQKMNVMQEMQKGEEKNEEKLKEHQDKMRETYTKIMSDPVMDKYMTAKEEADAFVNEIYGILNFAITGEEPGGCSGSCETYGGCH